jgi:hypothetical protein
MIGKFCQECGTQLSAPSTTPNAPAQVSTQTEVTECYFCERPLSLAESGEKHCSYCKRRQPNPKGPPCIHGCGARLITPDAKLCGRCCKQQIRTQPTDSVSSPGGGQASIGYGYPNTPTTGKQNAQPFGPPQFGPQALIQTAIQKGQQPPPSGHPHVQSKAAFPNSPSATTGMGGSTPSISKESPETGHPCTARSTTVEKPSVSEDSESDGSKNELKIPIQETAQLKETEKHALQSSSSKGNRKRKKASEPDDNGKSKQNKLEKNADDTQPHGDSDQVPNTKADTAKKPTVTSSDLGAATSTTTTTAASSTSTTTTTTATTTSTATTTDTNKVSIINMHIQFYYVIMNLLVSKLEPTITHHQVGRAFAHGIGILSVVLQGILVMLPHFLALSLGAIA